MSAPRIPKRLKQRPHWRGLPIPYIAYINSEGQPDFKVTDEAKRRSVIANRLCQLCGQLLGKWFFFVGGPEAATSNIYFEPACHLDCLMYAMQVCPFIAGKMDHVELETIQAKHPDLDIKVDETYATVKNPLWIIKKAVGWSHVRTKGGTILLVPHAIKQTQPLLAEEMTGSDWKRVMEELSK